MGDWWASLYDDLLAEVLLERASPAEVEATIDFLADRLELRPGATVFDQCSGIGSLAVPLAVRGYRVVGVEQAEGYVERARQEATAAGVGERCRFVASDAFAVGPGEPCDAAFNWWTSFGYALDDGQNRRMLAQAFEALVPGGVFVLDTLNLPGVLRGFREHEVTRRRTPRGEVVLVRESRVDPDAGALRKRWTYFLPDGRRVEHDSAVRLYLPHTLGELCRAEGFVEIELFGSIAGEPLALDSPRCLLRARKPQSNRARVEAAGWSSGR
jgi:SAM-dependent methyltransferase